MTVIPVPPPPAKREILELAFQDCAQAGYMFGNTADEYAMAQRTMDAMMAEWPFNTLGYDFSTDPMSGIAREFMTAVYTQLAARIAPGMGKELSSEQRRTRAKAFDRLCSVAGVNGLPEALYARNTPAGAGHRHILPFFDES